MMREASQEYYDLLGLPSPLAALGHPQGLLVLAKRRFNAGAAIVGIGHRGGNQLGESSEQRGILIATAFLFGRANDPLARDATKPMRLQDRGQLPARTGGGLPGTELLTEGPHPRAIADFPHELIASTEQPVEGGSSAKATIETKHDLRPPLTGPVETFFQFPQSRFERGQRRGFARQQAFMQHLAVVA